MITQSKLKGLFEYREDGNLISKTIRAGSAYKPGDIVGTLNEDGYLQIKIESRLYRLHTLIYIYHHGACSELIDHIDTNKLNNRIENLRITTHTTNQWNRGLFSNNTSGVKGLTYNKKSGTWQASVMANGKRNYKHFKGSYTCKETFQKATEWLIAKRKELHGEFANHG